MRRRDEPSNEVVDDERKGPSRRDFLKTAGLAALGTAALVPEPLFAPPAAQAAGRRGIEESTSRYFGRIFGNLPYFGRGMPPDALRAALLDIGKPGGIMDAQDDLAAGPVDLITELTLSLNNPNNPSMTAGAHFMGQFFDHDITFDVSSALGV